MEAPKDLSEWLAGQMKQRGWGVREMARRAGIPTEQLSTVFELGEKPAFDTCVALSKALDVPREVVLILAGHLPKPRGYSPLRDEWLGLIQGEDEEVVRQWIAAIRAMKERREEKKGAKRKLSR